MTTTRTSDLSWLPGQIINDEFADFAATMVADDILIFDDLFVLTGNPNISVPNGVTLAAGVQGAGIEIRSFTVNTNPSLAFGSGCTLLDFTIICQDSGETPIDTNGYAISAGDDFTFQNSTISGPQKELIRVSNADNFTVVDSEFVGSFYQIYMVGDMTNFSFTRALFRDSTGDGIKTARSGALGSRNGTVTDSVFLRQGRDGIDTTGGWKDVVHDGCYFVKCGVAGLDLKASPQTTVHLNTDLMNQNITVRNSEFIEFGGNAIVTTINDRGELASPPAKVLTDSNFYDWCPQDIVVEDCIFENAISGARFAVLNKGIDGMSLTDCQFLGVVDSSYKFATSPYNTHITVNQNINTTETGITTGAARTAQPDSYYEGLAGPDWSNITYPLNQPAQHSGSISIAFNG